MMAPEVAVPESLEDEVVGGGLDIFGAGIRGLLLDSMDLCDGNGEEVGRCCESRLGGLRFGGVELCCGK